MKKHPLGTMNEPNLTAIHPIAVKIWLMFGTLAWLINNKILDDFLSVVKQVNESPITRAEQIHEQQSGRLFCGSSLTRLDILCHACKLHEGVACKCSLVYVL